MSLAQVFRRFVPPAALLMIGLGSPASAQEWSSARPDGHAPIGVMGDHTHERGEVMLSYRYMPMRMEGNRDGTEKLTPADVLARFPVTPVRMPMSMHMFGVMAAPTSRLTLMGMVPIVDLSMDHRTRAGGMFTTEAAGLGDVRVTGLLRVLNRNRRAMHVNLGLSLPTGAIDRMGVTPASAPDAAILPYPMQLGSGTWDLLPGFTVLGQRDRWSWGAQGLATIRLGTNARGYRLGHSGTGTGWLSARLSDWVSASGRLRGSTWGNLHGADPLLNPNMVPTANPALRAGRRI
ncbi:MAG: transporter, partial [Vicinamibacterales bacterium]